MVLWYTMLFITRSWDGLHYIMSLSISCLIDLIFSASSLFSLVITLTAMTGREIPQARPSAALDATKTYGTF